MTEPTEEEFKIYERVKSYIEDEADERLYGYLGRGDSVYAEGDAKVLIGGPGGPVNDSMTKYEEGYYEAATQLIDWAAGRLEAAWTVYPILFLARHALELSLKSLILDIFAPVPRIVANQHNVSRLWGMVLTKLEEQHRYAVPKNAALITTVISELTEIDPTSMNSRYATTKDFLTPSIGNTQFLSLRNLEVIVMKLYNELFNIRSTIEQHQQHSSVWD